MILHFVLFSRRNNEMGKCTFCFATFFALVLTYGLAATNETIPAVIWHGMGRYFTYLGQNSLQIQV